LKGVAVERQLLELNGGLIAMDPAPGECRMHHSGDRLRQRDNLAIYGASWHQSVIAVSTQTIVVCADLDDYNRRMDIL
jgi:hypothetical protein